MDMQPRHTWGVVVDGEQEVGATAPVVAVDAAERVRLRGPEPAVSCYTRPPVRSEAPRRVKPRTEDDMRSLSPAEAAAVRLFRCLKQPNNSQSQRPSLTDSSLLFAAFPTLPPPQVQGDADVGAAHGHHSSPDAGTSSPPFLLQLFIQASLLGSVLDAAQCAKETARWFCTRSSTVPQSLLRDVALVLVRSKRLDPSGASLWLRTVFLELVKPCGGGVKEEDQYIEAIASEAELHRMWGVCRHVADVVYALQDVDVDQKVEVSSSEWSFFPAEFFMDALAMVLQHLSPNQTVTTAAAEDAALSSLGSEALISVCTLVRDNPAFRAPSLSESVDGGSTACAPPRLVLGWEHLLSRACARMRSLRNDHICFAIILSDLLA